MDDSQIGLIKSPGLIRSPQQLKNFVFGERQAPRLIVADINKNEAYDQKEILTKLVQQFNRQYQTSFKPVFSPWRDVSAIASLWFFVDPTYPGRKKVPLASGFKAAQGMIDGLTTDPNRFLTEDDEETFASMMAAYKNEPHKVRSKETRFGKQRRSQKYQQDKLLYIGTVYVLHYSPKYIPVDLHWSEGVQRRVRTHLAKEMKKLSSKPLPVHPQQQATNIRAEHPVDTKMAQKWYVMGLKDAPDISDRFKETPRGRIKKLRTYKPGAGFVRLKNKETSALKPLFVVNARNIDAAREVAQRKFDRLITNPRTADKGYELERQWLASGQKVVSVMALQKYRQR
jgi:hypothetical protein